MARRGYIFTDKSESKKGILSAFLGLLSLVSLGTAVYLSFRSHGAAPLRYGTVGLLCLLFSGAGLVLGILARMEEDTFHLFAVLGIVLNALTLAGVSMVLYAGAYRT